MRVCERFANIKIGIAFFSRPFKNRIDYNGRLILTTSIRAHCCRVFADDSFTVLFFFVHYSTAIWIPAVFTIDITFLLRRECPQLPVDITKTSEHFRLHIYSAVDLFDLQPMSIGINDAAMIQHGSTMETEPLVCSFSSGWLTYLDSRPRIFLAFHRRVSKPLKISTGLYLDARPEYGLHEWWMMAPGRVRVISPFYDFRTLFFYIQIDDFAIILIPIRIFYQTQDYFGGLSNLGISNHKQLKHFRAHI